MPAEKIHRISAEDLYKFLLISGTRISPNGDLAVFAVERVDRKVEKKFNNLWIVPTLNGPPRQFTFGNHQDSQPQWSPNGRQIAFLSDRIDPDKPAQLFLIPIDGGEARQLADIPGKIESFEWSPDGKKIVCALRKTDPEELARQQDAAKKELGTVFRQYDRVFYKLDDLGYLPKERIHIWVVDIRTGKAKQLTDHPIYDEQFPTWSPDGKLIAFLSNRTENPDFKLDYIDLFVMPSSGGAFQKINTPVGEKVLPSFSPDGKWLAYIGSEGENQPYNNHGVWIIRVDGSSPACNLTAAYDIHVDSFTINDLGSPEKMLPVWSADSQKVYFQAVLHGSTVLMSVNRDGSNLQTVLGDQGAVGSFSFDRQQNRLAYFFGQSNDPGQIFFLDLAQGTRQQLTNFNQTLLSSLDLGQMETMWTKGAAGNDIQGWIIKPPGFRPDQKYPSILEIHGGPLTQYGFLFMHEFYFLAAQGFVVHFCNPRGGRGYGESHAKAISHGWGQADYDDIIAWTDTISGLPYIDSDRMGVTGGSYGGYMTNWIIGHTDRFKAAVTQRSVSNLVSMWGSSDFNWAFQIELNNQPPYENLQKYWDHSPMKYIGNATTPTMVIHSEMDLRCPIEQGEQIFVALKSLGVDSEFIRFPDEFHGLSRTGRTDRRVARLTHMLRWFKKYLQVD